VAEPIHGGGVNPVNSGLDGVLDGGNRLAVILAAPGVRPTGAADGPPAESDAGDVHARCS
jgi:hypothetical protein